MEKNTQMKLNGVIPVKRSGVLTRVRTRQNMPVGNPG